MLRRMMNRIKAPLTIIDNPNKTPRIIAAVFSASYSTVTKYHRAFTEKENQRTDCCNCCKFSYVLFSNDMTKADLIWNSVFTW